MSKKKKPEAIADDEVTPPLGTQLPEETPEQKAQRELDEPPGSEEAPDRKSVV